MYLLIDEYGVIRGQTSDPHFVNDLKEALESLGCQITVERTGVNDCDEEISFKQLVFAVFCSLLVGFSLLVFDWWVTCS